MTPPDTSELILIRHAPADHGGRLCGRRDVPATLGAQALWRPVQDLISSAKIRVTSPAQRCRQTASALWPGDDLPSDPRLWEQDFGDHDGLRFDELPDIGILSPGALAEHRSPNGESFADMVVRVRPALGEMAEQAAQGAGPVVVVAHAGTVRAALAMALDNLPAALTFEVAPWSVTRLRAYVADGRPGLSVICTNWRPL